MCFWNRNKSVINFRILRCLALNVVIFVHKICPKELTRYTHIPVTNIYTKVDSIKDIFAKLKTLVFKNKGACIKCFCAFLFIGLVDDAWTFADELQEQIYSNDVNVEQNMNRHSEKISEKSNSTSLSNRSVPSSPKEIRKKITPPPPPPKRTMSTGTSPPPQSISTQVKCLSNLSGLTFRECVLENMETLRLTSN